MYVEYHLISSLMITITGRLWFPLFGQLDCQQGAVQGRLTLDPMEESGRERTRARINALDQLICLFNQNASMNPKPLSNMSKIYKNLTNLGRIWFAEEASSRELWLIPLILFCKYTRVEFASQGTSWLTNLNPPAHSEHLRFGSSGLHCILHLNY